MNKTFRDMMRSVDDDLLEEAITPMKKRNFLPWISAAVAACLLIVLGVNLFPRTQTAVTISMPYDMKLPENAERVRYETLNAPNQAGAQVSFVIRDTAYVYQVVETPEPLALTSSQSEEQLLAWNAGDLDIQLLSSASHTSVSWYLQDEQTQWYLTANADPREVLTTASQIFRLTGLNVTVAPEGAENITYNAFLFDGLTVAETTFQLKGVTYAYRMAATAELREDFADISGLETFPENATAKVFWCSAKLSFQPGGQGKILWFDVVPGIIYSLSMDSGASEETLLNTAQALFEPTQHDS